MEKFFMGVLIVCAVVGFVLGFWWLLWCLWTWVLPQIWPTGPEALIRPGYWLFAGVWFLLACLGRAIFRRESK